MDKASKKSDACSFHVSADVEETCEPLQKSNAADTNISKRRKKKGKSRKKLGGFANLILIDKVCQKQRRVLIILVWVASAVQGLQYGVF